MVLLPRRHREVWTALGHAGEETALLNALASDRGMPAIRPPYPAATGLRGAPTIVNNAETLAHVAWIASHSAEAFATAGTESSRGTKLVTLMGRVAEPGLIEVPLGISLLDLLEAGGGVVGAAKAAFVGGPGGGAIDAGAFQIGRKAAADGFDFGEFRH